MQFSGERDPVYVYKDNTAEDKRKPYCYIKKTFEKRLSASMQTVSFIFYKYRLSVAVFKIVFVFLDHLLHRDTRTTRKLRDPIGASRRSSFS